MKHFFIQKPIIKEDESLFHMLWFAEAWTKKGYMPINQKNRWINKLYYPLPKRIKLFILSVLTILKKTKKKKLILPMSGFNCLLKTFPVCYDYEIIPYVWDCWPMFQTRFSLLMKIIKPKICFVSSSIVAKELSKMNTNIEFYYIPEGINCSVYIAGDNLKNRTNDVLELGRIHKDYHKEIIDTQNINIKYNSNNIHIYPTFKSLVQGLSDTKIVICFPRSDTHDMARGTETLTQRYWECMLSKCLIVGRAPFELIELIGYNPVIDIEWGKEKSQLTEIIANIGKYQDLVDKNYNYALKYAPWDNRIQQMIEIINKTYLRK